jgi:speckle-type POZ protein
MPKCLDCISTGCEIIKVHFFWSVEVPFLQTTDGGREAIDSRLYSSFKSPGTQWKLLVFDTEPTIKIVVFQYTMDMYTVQMLSTDRLTTSIENGNDWKKMASHSAGCEMPKSECRQLVDRSGRLTFSCEILTGTLVRKTPDSSSNSPVGVDITCSDGLATQFEELFDSMENSDVIFKIGGRPFPAHKLILVTRCQVFAVMFKHETKEKLSNEIEIKDVEPDVFHQLLRFIYTGRLSLKTMETMAVALFIAADKYLLDQLTNKCELFLLYKMTPVNCLELLLHADLLNFAKLKEDAAVYFRRHKERVMATDKWQIVEQECPSLLGDIQECILAKIS